MVGKRSLIQIGKGKGQLKRRALSEWVEPHGEAGLFEGGGTLTRVG